MTSANASQGLDIKVTDPIKHNEGVNAWIGYTVTTQTSRQEFRSPTTTVLRRFSDFFWLHAKLGSVYPGAIVPPLPEKALVGRFEASFVEVRRRALERFLVRVGNHPELGQSRDLVTFLQADEASLAQAKEEWKREQGTPPTKVLKMFQKAFTQVEHSLSSAPTGSVEVPRTAHDAAIEDMTTTIHVLEVQYHNVSKEGSTLLRKEKDVSDSYFQLGLALTLLGQNEAGGLGEALRCTGHALDSFSVLENAAVEKDGLHLEEPLVEWSRTVAAAKAALLRRGEVKKSYLEALIDVSQRLHVKNKLVGMIGKEDKLNAAEAAWTKAVQASEAKRKEYEAVSERLLRDFAAFKKEKAQELKLSLTAYIEQQAAHHQKMKDGWTELLPKIQKVDVMKDLDLKTTTTTAGKAVVKSPTKSSKNGGEEEGATVVGV